MSAHLMVLRERIEGYKYVGVEFVRILFGLYLVGKGYLFSQNSAELIHLIGLINISVSPDLIIHYLIAAHVAGGLMIAIGLYTRPALILQLPAVIGAVLTTHASNGFLSSGLQLESASLALLFLIWFIYTGSGKLSMDYLVIEKKDN
jgi:putative oxidoreductase